MTKISIIGAGNVGASIAYACIFKKIASEILLVDIDTQRCEAQVSDMSDCSFLTDTKIKVGTFQEAGQCDLIVITAGARQIIGEARIQLIERNYAILKSCIQSMMPFKPTAVILLVSNPVDILTYFAQKLSGLPHSQVLGSGTFLDSARLRSYLSEKLQVAETAIHAYVVGEHGDSQFVAWSSAHASGIPLLEMEALKGCDLKKIAEEVKDKAYRIIEAKGSTYYGIGGCAASIIESVLYNSLHVRPVSHYIKELGVCISVPAVIGKHGVHSTMMPPLSVDEQAKLEESAANMKAIIDKYESL